MPARAKDRRKMPAEERTLEALEALPRPQRTLAVPAYLIAAYYPWWITLAAVSAILGLIFRGVSLFAWAVGLFFILAAGGYLAKGAIERWAGDGPRD